MNPNPPQSPRRPRFGVGPCRRRRLLLVAALAAVSVGCSDSSEDSSDSAQTTTSASAPSTSTSTTIADLSDPDDQDLYLVRYCEFLTVDLEGSAIAEVWNTLFLNDCPQEAWDQIDLVAVAADVGSDLAIPNGPRYWVLDAIARGGDGTGSLEVRELSGIEMRSVTTVELADVTDLSPYSETSVLRDTVFTFSAGREIYELTAPDGSIYVMQSYSEQVDPAQTVDDLSTLGARLDLPEGWTFEARVAAEDLDVMTVDGLATIIQDELKNTYQLRSSG